jgi:predicted deacylase
MTRLKKYFYDSGFPGPRLLIIGCIHGREVCGYNAMMRLCEMLDNNEIQLKCGTLALIPKCNPPAFDARVRDVNVNLGRIIGKHEKFESYEYEIAGQIAAAIEECDYLLDIHSFVNVGGAPFVFQDYDDAASLSAALIFGLPVIKGWPELYQDSDEKKVGDAGFYANRFGKIPVTVECGTNGSKAADGVAACAIMKMLVFLGMLDGHSANANDNRVYRMEKIIWRDRPGKLCKPWKNFDFIPTGTIVAEYDDGETLSFDYDFYIIMPKDDARIGTEWFYISTCPSL